MTKILITGGAGYIGSVLTEYLLFNSDYKITVVDNFIYNSSALNHLYHFSNLTILNLDVRNYDQLEQVYKNYDIIIPLAALVGAPICQKDPIGSKLINYDSVVKMLEGLSKNQSVIMPTTNSAYGQGQADNFCDENSPLNPISNYAKEKVELEKRLMDFDNTISFRLATVFGMSPRLRLDLLVNDMTYKAYKDQYVVLYESHFKRNYIHVRDVARVFDFSIKNFNSMKNNIFNVGLEDANLSKQELCNKIKNHLPNLAIYNNELNKDPDQRNYIVSNKKIIKTGFITKYSIDDGIEELIKGFASLKKFHLGNI